MKTENTQSAKKWLKFNCWGGGRYGVKTENTQSAKKWLNFNFRGGGVLYCSESTGTLRILDQNFNHSSRLMHHR